MNEHTPEAATAGSPVAPLGTEMPATAAARANAADCRVGDETRADTKAPGTQPATKVPANTVACADAADSQVGNETRADTKAPGTQPATKVPANTVACADAAEGQVGDETRADTVAASDAAADADTGAAAARLGTEMPTDAVAHANAADGRGCEETRADMEATGAQLGTEVPAHAASRAGAADGRGCDEVGADAVAATDVVAATDAVPATDSVVDADAAAVTRVFGIRHHGPGSARSLRHALEEFRPDAILIEGPADADPLVGFVAAETMSPPVALLAYVPDSPARAAFWPFAAFSPEWQALRYGAEHAVPVRFCDLPAAQVLAADEDSRGDRTDPLGALAAAAGYDDAERWWDAVIESVPDSTAFDAITEAMATLREDAPHLSPTPGAATEPTFAHPDDAPAVDRTAQSEPGAQPHPESAAGPQSPLVGQTQPGGDAAESAPGPQRGRQPEPGDRDAHPTPTARPDTADTPRPSTMTTPDQPHDTDSTATESDHPTALSEPGPALVVDQHTLRREAHMRQVMRQVLKGGAKRLAVVCGAWHAPALTGPLGPAAPDARVLKGLPKTKAALTWVPWTHSRLASGSGYGAGVTSPGWYHHLFTETERPVARWLTKVAGVLRAHDLPVSSAHIIEAVRLADTLAALRGRPLAGLSEVTEAVRSVMCGGNETMLRLVVDELVVGETLGAVPEDTPTVPLAADLRARSKTLRLKQEALARTLDLDLRKDRDVERSHLLHRLRLLGIDWGTPSTGEVRSTGTFRETWTLRWEPEFEVRIVEAAVWGTTLRTAAAAKILDTASRDGVSVTALAETLELALLADLGEATDGLITRLEAAAALDHDVTHLLGALPGLTRTLRYGDVRGTDTKALAHVADGLLVRICAGLPGAVTGLDTDAAEALRAQIDAAHTAISTRDDERTSTEWLATLQRIADRDDVHGAIGGRAVRLLCDAERIDDAESARRLAAALSIGNTPAAKAAWIDGFLGGRGLLLVHDRELLRRIDDWLRDLAEDQFVATLPLLRRTFGSFESGERRAIGQALREGGSAPAAPAGSTATDPLRGQLALHAAAAILGAAG